MPELRFKVQLKHDTPTRNKLPNPVQPSPRVMHKNLADRAQLTLRALANAAAGAPADVAR